MSTPYQHRGRWDTPAADRIPKNRSERASQYRAAIHEAAHILVAFKHGFGNAWGRLDPAYIADLEGKPPFFTGYWVGEMINGVRQRYDGTHDVANREIGIAGAIGECLLDRHERFREASYWNDHLDEDGPMSDTDWRTAGFDPEEEWVDDNSSFMKSAHAVGDFLKANFSKVLAIARQLIAESANPPDMDIFRYVSFYTYEDYGDPETYARFLRRYTMSSRRREHLKAE